MVRSSVLITLPSTRTALPIQAARRRSEGLVVGAEGAAENGVFAWATFTLMDGSYRTCGCQRGYNGAGGYFMHVRRLFSSLLAGVVAVMLVTTPGFAQAKKSGAKPAAKAA